MPKLPVLTAQELIKLLEKNGYQLDRSKGSNNCWNMDNRLKYFWDAESDAFSPEYRLVRLFEYASFYDLLKIPYSELCTGLKKIKLDHYRIPEARQLLLERIKPYLSTSRSMAEAIKQYVDAVLERNEAKETTNE